MTRVRYDSQRAQDMTFADGATEYISYTRYLQVLPYRYMDFDMLVNELHI